jgi:hypothetical protein
LEGGSRETATSLNGNDPEVTVLVDKNFFSQSFTNRLYKIFIATEPMHYKKIFVQVKEGGNFAFTRSSSNEIVKGYKHLIKVVTDQKCKPFGLAPIVY